MHIYFHIFKKLQIRSKFSILVLTRENQNILLLTLNVIDFQLFYKISKVYLNKEFSLPYHQFYFRD